MALGGEQAHHIQNVLRMPEGAVVELFDDAGRTARGTILRSTSGQVTVNVESISQPDFVDGTWSIASALPKASRADWMVEKLSELGASEFIPLITDRSVVHPKGENKMDRWRKIAEEAARQSHRSGVMRIAPLMPVEEAISNSKDGCYLSTRDDAISVTEIGLGRTAMFFIGPEGGWSPGEIEVFQRHNLTGVSMGRTILRVETAAIAAAVVASVMLGSRRGSSA